MNEKIHYSFPKLGFTLLLFTFLIVPFAISWHYTEPFPAIILPGGKARFNFDSKIHKSTEYKLYGIKNGQPTRINFSVLPNGHPKFLNKLYNREMNLSKDRISKKQQLINSLFPWKKVTDADLANSKKWLRIKTGDQYDSLYIEKVTVLKNSVTEEIESQTLSDSSYYDISNEENQRH